MKLDETTSSKITYLRFPLIFGVVLIHAYATNIYYADTIISISKQNYPIAFFVTNLFSQVWGRVSVPFFFLLSGYLLYYGKEISKELILEKYNKRFYSLVIPYVIWNLLGLFVYWFFQNLPATQQYFSGRVSIINESSFWQIINQTFGITIPPIVSQFWFIRNLIILVIISPLLYNLLNRFRHKLLFFFAILWFLATSHIDFREGLIFFTLGLYFAHFNNWLKEKNNLHTVVWIYIITSVFEAWFYDESNWLIWGFHKINIILGILSFWVLIGKAENRSRVKKTLLYLSPLAFFVFASHQPLMQFIKKAAYRLFAPFTDIKILIIYFSVITLVLCITISSALFLKKFTPKLYAVVTGGRYSP